jgi:hypothetical protein
VGADVGFVRTLAIAAVIGGFAGISWFGASLESRLLHGWRSGYPLGRLLDVAIDGAPYTRQLLNGVGAFAGVAPGERWAFMRRRRWGALAAALGFLVTLILIIRGALRPAEAMALGVLGDAIISVTPFLLGVAFSRVATWPERRTAGIRWIAGGLPAFRPRIRADLVRAWLGTVGHREFRPPGRLLRLLARGLLAIPSVAFGLATVLAAALLLTPSIMLDRSRMGSVTTEARAHALALAAVEQALAALGSRPAGPVPSDSVRRAALSVDVSVHPSGDSLFAAWDGASAGLSRARLEANAAAEGLDAWRAIAAARALPEDWYVAGDSSDDLLADGDRASHGAQHAARHNSAAALLALRAGGTTAATTRAREIVWLGWHLLSDPDPRIHAAALDVLRTAGRTLEALGRQTDDSVMEARGAALWRAADERAETLFRYRFAWIGELAEATGLDSARLARWRRALSEADRQPVDRRLIYEAMLDAMCWNRREIVSGPASVRREAREETARALEGAFGQAIWTRWTDHRWQRLSGASRTFAYRWGYCLGMRAGYQQRSSAATRPPGPQ